MIKEIENIIKNKTYFELTNDERIQVKEWAQNEEEYNNMKWFLTGATSFAASEKITASPALKKGVMAHLTESKKKKGFWLNSVGVLALPKQVPFYRKPVFQLGIAAVAVIGLLFFFNKGMDEDNLALNDTPIDTPNQKIQPVENPALEQDGLKDNETSLTEENSELRATRVEDKDVLLEPDGIFKNKDESELKEQGLGSVSSSSIPPPPIILNEIEAVEDDEEVQLISDMVEGIDIDDEVLAEMEETNEILETESIRFGSASTDEKRERTKGVLKKKVLRAQKDSKNQDSRSDLLGESDDSPSFEGGGIGGENDEWIKPKSLHINKTKELNSLFFTVK